MAILLAVQAAVAEQVSQPAIVAAKTSVPAIAVGNVALVSAADCPPAAPPACSVYKPCVSYCHRGRCCDSCSPRVQQVLLVKDPCDCCCAAEVPVCLPACCKDACVSSKCGLFGRSFVTYEYDCGVCVTITFRRCGDVLVTYRGC
jgi:hypothetical protein